MATRRVATRDPTDQSLGGPWADASEAFSDYRSFLLHHEGPYQVMDIH